jgi:hypothetical protein
VEARARVPFELLAHREEGGVQEIFDGRGHAFRPAVFGPQRRADCRRPFGRVDVHVLLAGEHLGFEILQKELIHLDVVGADAGEDLGQLRVGHHAEKGREAVAALSGEVGREHPHEAVAGLVPGPERQVVGREGRPGGLRGQGLRRRGQFRLERLDEAEAARRRALLGLQPFERAHDGQLVDLAHLREAERGLGEAPGDGIEPGEAGEHRFRRRV